MKAKLLSTIFACLLCLTSSDKEGYFTISTTDKSWEFFLNNSTNAQKLADKLKEEGSMTLIFAHYPSNENYACKDYQFGFEEDETQNQVEAYDIYGHSIYEEYEYMEIILKKFDKLWYGTKMGYLKDGMNKLDEFNSTLCVGDANLPGDCKVTFTLAYAERDIVDAERDIVEPKTDIVEPETDIVEPETDIVEPEVAKFPWLIVSLVVITVLGIIVLIFV